MAAVLYFLGGYRFQAGAGADELSRSSKWRWKDQEVIGAPPVLQYVGPGEDSFTVKGSIYPQFRGGLGQVDAMRGQAGRGQPLAFGSGAGEYFGEFVIEEVSEEKKVLNKDGSPRHIEFSITLKRFS
jgi:phage protein U